MGQPELGLKELELALHQNPDNLQIADLLAQNYEELGKFEAARQLYQEALTRRGSNPAMANNFCFSYYAEGRWQEAEACFRKTLALVIPAMSQPAIIWGSCIAVSAARTRPGGFWQETEGAAANAKIGEALAASGDA